MSGGGRPGLAAIRWVACLALAVSAALAPA